MTGKVSGMGEVRSVTIYKTLFQNKLGTVPLSVSNTVKQVTFPGILLQIGNYCHFSRHLILRVWKTKSSSIFSVSLFPLVIFYLLTSFSASLEEVAEQVVGLSVIYI